MNLYEYQQATVDALLKGKHFCIAGTGCLAKGTPIPLADGTYKNVEELKRGDRVLSCDEYGNIIPNEVRCVIKTTQKPKPMISFEYDGEEITTTYDHYFDAGRDKYYPIYQLIWGALETSQRVQLKLLCEQYGQTFDYEVSRFKTSRSNEPSFGYEWILSDSDEWENCESSQDSSGKLVKEPKQIAFSKSYKLQSERQSSGEPGVGDSEIQYVVWNPLWAHQDTTASKEHNLQRTKERDKNYCYADEGGFVVCPKSKEKIIQWVKKNNSRANRKEISRVFDDDKKFTKVIFGRDIKIKIKEAEPYYSISMEKAPYSYCIGRKHHYMTHNTGKGFIGLEWARKTRKKRVLVITQASKRDSDDYAKEARILDDKWYGSLSSFETISWNGLKKWLDGNLRQRTFDISEYAIIADECHRFKAGVSSGMGKAMLKIAKMTECWTGYTATPGDKWIDFCAYFMATNKVRTKTRFLDDYCYVQTFKGYPEIVEYRHEDVLKDWWREISFAPDSSSVERQLPAEVGKVVHFKAPTGYKKVLATRKRLDTDEFIDTNMGLVQYARQLCFTKEKQQWCSDFIEGLGDNAVFFCNYIEEEDRLCELAEKVLPKGARVWRIDGKHHEIPTAETIGPRDIVVAHYQSGGASLNLQFIHYWVAVSANWSYSMNVQAKGRIRRIGQQHKMFYYYLMCDDCIDEDVYDTVHEKKDFAAKVWCLEKGFADDGSL